MWADEYEEFQAVLKAEDKARARGQKRKRSSGNVKAEKVDEPEPKATKRSSARTAKATKVSSPKSKAKSTTRASKTAKPASPPSPKKAKAKSSTKAKATPATTAVSLHVIPSGGHWHFGDAADHEHTEKCSLVKQMNLKAKPETVLKTNTVFRLRSRRSGYGGSVQYHILQLAVIDVNRGKGIPSPGYVAFVRDRSSEDREWSTNDNNVRVYEARWLIGADTGYVLPAFEPASSATTASGQAVWKAFYDSTPKFGRSR